VLEQAPLASLVDRRDGRDIALTRARRILGA
jgi:hypothetical protein